MNKSIVDDIYKKIRDDIINGVISSSNLLLEQAIAEKYGVSKVSAKQALQKLCNEKYLICYPRKGYLINDISPTQKHQIQQVRYQIESLAIKTIIKNCTDAEIESLYPILQEVRTENDPYDTVNSKFHLKMAELSQNKYIYDTLYIFIGYASRYAMTAPIPAPVMAEKNHRNIISAVLARDLKKALKTLIMDLELTEDDI